MIAGSRSNSGPDRGEALGAEQAFLGGGGEPEASLVGDGCGCGHVDESGGGLLFEPLLRVSGVDAGALGQLAGVDAAVGRQVLVEAEFAAEARW